MAYTTVNKSSSFMNTKLYTGDGNTSNAITGVGFQPDLVWIKDRDAASNHQLQDAVRGKSGSNYYSIHSDSTAAQSVQGDDDGLNTLGADGFTVGYTNSTAWNENDTDYVSWNWKANGAGSSNTDGSITSTVSVNTTADFSIVKYSGNDSASATIGHGLGSKPAVVIMKPLTSAGTAWWIVHKDLTTDYVLEFNNNAEAPISGFGGGGLKYSTFTTSVIGGGNGSSNSDLWNKSGEDYIAYCFAEVPGYSKFSSYLGNGFDNGAFIYTGFKPSWVMVKNKASGNHWMMYDNKVIPHNLGDKLNRANTSAAEIDNASGEMYDFLSNGFKARASSNNNTNYSGNTYIYMAFGQTLVGTNNIPATAR